MKPSLRGVLADSNISAIAIAVLLLWSLEDVFRALWDPLVHAAEFLFTAMAILGIPYYSPRLTVADRVMLITTSSYLFSALISFAPAWLLSRWVYGVGPFRSLSKCCSGLTRRDHV
jgi:hypothetical protein